MNAVLERSFCAQAPHRARMPRQLREAHALLDRVAVGDPIRRESVDWALRVTGDLREAWPVHAGSRLRNLTSLEGQS